jgi:glutathione peroxidase
MSLYDIEVTTIDGEPLTMGMFRGRTLLIVNVASRCGFTPQYAELEALYRRHQSRGFVVCGFPCNQFAHQEPGDEADIKSFCSTRYNVSFPLFSKIDVNGARAHPLYRHLKSAKRGPLGIRAVLWNFTKFLVNKQGEVIRRYGSRVRPQAIEPDLIGMLD